MNPIFKAVDTVLDKIIPDAAERDNYKMKMREMEFKGQFTELNAAMANILAEAKSDHVAVALARPMFLYVIYIFILSAIPMGIYYAYDPTNAAEVAKGVKEWLDAIPDQLYYLFGVGYLGYTKKRSDDKELAAGMQPKKFLNLF